MDCPLISLRKVYYVELAGQLRNLAHQALFAAARSELIKLAKRFDLISVEETRMRAHPSHASPRMEESRSPDYQAKAPNLLKVLSSTRPNRTTSTTESKFQVPINWKI